MKKNLLLAAALTLALLFISGCEGNYNPTDVPSTLSGGSKVEAIPQEIKEPYPPDVTLKFAACGDNIIYTGTMRDAKSLAASGGRKYNFAPLYENIKDIISGADIAFINQETPMADNVEYGSYPHFNSPRDLADDMIEAGFDIVNIATNHMLDAGSDGLKSTIEFWKTKPVTMIGGYENEEDFDTVRIYEKDEMKIALLSFTYSTNGLSLRNGYDIVIPYIDEAVIREKVSAAKEVADLVFVSMHWGNENSFKPSNEQKRLASVMAELGVDVIIGHHPHVLEPIEWIEGENGHKTLCIYSLGNLVAEQARDYNLVGGIMTFDIVRTSGEYSIENPYFIPTVYYYSKSFYKNSVHLMENFTDEMAKSIGLSYYGQSTTIEKLRGYVTKTIDAQFLPDYLK